MLFIPPCYTEMLAKKAEKEVRKDLGKSYPVLKLTPALKEFIDDSFIELSHDRTGRTYTLKEGYHMVKKYNSSFGVLYYHDRSSMTLNTEATNYILCQHRKRSAFARFQ